jgi:MFS family permease
MKPELHTDWRTIFALNAVSTLSQIGQFGIGFVVLPLWLVEHGLNAAQLGLFASVEWLGMLIGLAIAPRFNIQLGHRVVIAIGLLASMLALAVIPYVSWPMSISAAALVGLGTGLRWIGLEPWLYRIAPSEARGRLIGFHETLISIGSILAPMLAKWVGVSGAAPLLLGVGFTGAALLPLMFARPAPNELPEVCIKVAQETDFAHKKILRLGIVIAVIGGVTEAAFSGLFPLFGVSRGLGTDQIATLLAVFGLGGLLLQYLIGWLADHRGLAFATLVNAAGIVFIAGLAALPLGYFGLSIAVFALGGTITAYLTLALIASTQAGDGDMSVNVTRISMAYTASSIFGPLIAGVAMKSFSREALIWQVGVLAGVLCVYVLSTMLSHRVRVH